MTSPEPSSSVGPSEELSQETQDLVVALLRQQETLLTELRWAYDQLERVNDFELTELRERVTRLEGKKRITAPAESTASLVSVAQKTKRRVQFAIQEPWLATQAAKRRLKNLVRKASGTQQ